MPKYWPAVMWFKDVEDGKFVYIPSFSHHFVDDDRMIPVQSYPSYEEALQAAIRLLRGETPTGAVALFRPYVIEQDTEPNYGQRGSKGKPVLTVTKLAVNEDGYIAANEQRFTGED